MKRILWFVLDAVLLLTLAGCLKKQPQAMAPEIGYVIMEGQQCPKIKTENRDEDKIINTINAEIEAHFLSLIPHKVDGSAWDDIVVPTHVCRIFTSILIPIPF